MEDLNAALRRLLADAETHPAPPLQLPGGVAWDNGAWRDPVHLIDGDGSSMCGRIDADQLVRITDDAFGTVNAERRCRTCDVLLAMFRDAPPTRPG